MRQRYIGSVFLAGMACAAHAGDGMAPAEKVAASPTTSLTEAQRERLAGWAKRLGDPSVDVRLLAEQEFRDWLQAGDFSHKEVIQWVGQLKEGKQDAQVLDKLDELLDLLIVKWEWKGFTIHFKSKDPIEGVREGDTVRFKGSGVIELKGTISEGMQLYVSGSRARFPGKHGVEGNWLKGSGCYKSGTKRGLAMGECDRAFPIASADGAFAPIVFKGGEWWFRVVVEDGELNLERLPDADLKKAPEPVR